MAFKIENTEAKRLDEKSFDGGIDSILKKEIEIFGKSFGSKKKQYFYQELAVLLKAGVSLKDGLGLISESMKKKNDKERIENVLSDLIQGASFSDSLKKTGQFSEYEIQSLKIGEETGNIDRICDELGVYYARKNEQNRVIIAALTYPSIVLCTAMLVVVFMLTYVVPMFEDIFRQNKMELPFLTKMVVQLSYLLKEFGFYFLVLVLTLLFSVKFFAKNPAYKKIIHNILLKTPLVGPFVSKVYMAQFIQAVALLTASKVPMLTSIEMVSEMIGFVPLQESLERIKKSIVLGNSLSGSMKGDALFDNRIISLVKVAEETNQTEYVFKQLNEQFSQELLTQSKTLSTVLEPLIILIVGGLVAVLLVAMYLPMFQLSSVIG
jgi:type II secretory pathway component PulF